jgi:hypothetical protein
MMVLIILTYNGLPPRLLPAVIRALSAVLVKLVHARRANFPQAGMTCSHLLQTSPHKPNCRRWCDSKMLLLLPTDAALPIKKQRQ